MYVLHVCMLCIALISTFIFSEFVNLITYTAVTCVRTTCESITRRDINFREVQGQGGGWGGGWGGKERKGKRCFILKVLKLKFKLVSSSDQSTLTDQCDSS